MATKTRTSAAKAKKATTRSDSDTESVESLVQELGHRIYRVAEQGTVREWITIESLVESAEILFSARKSVRDLVSDHIRETLASNWEIYQETPLVAPLHVTIANAGSAFTLAGNIRTVYRDAFNELKALNQERSARIMMVD